MARPALTRRRLLGLDRSGPPPPETLAGAPLRPFTLPNFVGFLRLAAIPVYLVVAFGSGDGRLAIATVIFGLISWADQLDGLLARLTGQYSRLGTLLDPLTDRALILSGAAVAWHFELLPRWALALLAAREVFMLVMSQLSLRRGIDLKINMLGRWAVWPLMSGLGLAMIFDSWVATAVFLVGVAMTLAATALYVQDGLEQLRGGPSTST